MRATSLNEKKTEQALRTTERLASVGRMAATVAHEINNPLEAVTNLVYLAKGSAVSKDVQEYLNAIEERTEPYISYNKADSWLLSRINCSKCGESRERCWTH